MIERDYLRRENRILRYLLAEAVHGLGRAVSMTSIAIENDATPKKTAVVTNPVTMEIIVMPRHD